MSWNALVGLATLACVGAASADVIGHWPFDERAGTEVADLIGSVNGALVGGTSLAPAAGVAGGCLDLDAGTGSLVNFGDHHGMADGGDFSISMWIRTTDIGADAFPIAKHRSGVVAGYFLFVNTTACYGQTQHAGFYQSTTCGGEVTSTTPVTDDQWHHVVATYDADATLSIYVDGAPVEDTIPASSIPATAAPLLLGGISIGNTPTAFYSGQIDDLQIYDQPLNADQVQNLHDHPGQVLPFCAGDLEQDGHINVNDLLAMLAAWGTCADCRADLNTDGSVDIVDLLDLLGLWGTCPLID